MNMSQQVYDFYDGFKAKEYAVLCMTTICPSPRAEVMQKVIDSLVNVLKHATQNQLAMSGDAFQAHILVFVHQRL